MSGKKNVFHETTISEDGEVLQRRWISKEANSRSKFIKMYLEDLSALRKLTHAQFRILFELCTYLTYNTNDLYLNKQRREEMSEKIGVAKNTIDKGISRLMDEELLLKTASGVYQMNPKYFFNGDETERDKILEVVLTYKLTGK